MTFFRARYVQFPVEGQETVTGVPPSTDSFCVAGPPDWPGVLPIRLTG